MTMFRMPIFTWNVLLTSVMVLLAFPVLAAALLVLESDRKFRPAHVFDGANGGALTWRICSVLRHPEVYIIALPFFGIITEVIPVFSRKPFGSATSGWSARPSRSPACRWRCGPTTCSPPAK